MMMKRNLFGVVMIMSNFSMTVYDKIDFIIRKDMEEISKMKKRDLLIMVMELKESLLLELPDDVIQTIYDERKKNEPIL